MSSGSGRRKWRPGCAGGRSRCPPSRRGPGWAVFFLCSCLGWGAFEGRGEAFGLHLSDSPAEEIQMLCVVTFDTEKSLLIKKTFIHGEGNARDIDEEHQADLIQHYTSLEKS